MINALRKRIGDDPILPQELLPNFLIVGAAKAGTTSLYKYLIQHPDVFMPHVKEPHCFVDNWGIDLDNYVQIFQDGRTKKARGEASTGYLYSPESPHRIKQFLNDVRIIILLRDPAERAFSLYSWMVMNGYESSSSLTEALRREPVRQADPAFARHSPQFFPDYLYFASGLYSQQVKRYIDEFGRDKVKIILFEDLAKHPLLICKQVFTFLGVDSSFAPAIGAHNRSRRPCSVFVQFWLRKTPTNSFFRPWKKFAMALNNRLGRYPARPKNLIQDLRERYRQDLRELEILITRDLSHWSRSVRFSCD